MMEGDGAPRRSEELMNAPNFDIWSFNIPCLVTSRKHTSFPGWCAGGGRVTGGCLAWIETRDSPFNRYMQIINRFVPCM